MSNQSQDSPLHFALPAPRLHPFFRLLLCVAGCVVVQILIVLVVSAATAVAASLSGQDASTQVSKFIGENLLLVNLLVYPPTLLWIWVCRRFFDRRAFISLGLRARHFFSQIFSGLACGALACAFIFGVLALTGHARIVGVSLEAQRGGVNNSIGLLFAWLGVMVSVGFFEEVCFRGYALHNLNAWLGARAAIVIQAAAFALVHLGNLAFQDKSTPDAALAAILAMPNIFLFGIFVALCYFKTGSLWFPIAFHAAWNFCLGCIFSSPVSGLPIFKLFDVQITGSTFLTGGSFGPEASVLLTPILIALCFTIARATDSPVALFDLNSLKIGAPETEEILDVPQPRSEDDEARENRFRSTMRPRTLELDADTAASLRVLNSERKERETEKRVEIFAAASTSITPEASSPIITPAQYSARAENAEVIKEKPTPVEIVEAPRTDSTPLPARDESASTPLPKKPAPRW